MFDSLDPNMMVGWLIFAGVIAGALYKLGRWLNKLISIGTSIIVEMGALRKDVTNLEQQTTGHRVALGYLLGKAGEPLEKLDELIEKGKVPL